MIRLEQYTAVSANRQHEIFRVTYRRQDLQLLSRSSVMEARDLLITLASEANYKVSSPAFPIRMFAASITPRQLRSGTRKTSEAFGPAAMKYLHQQFQFLESTWFLDDVLGPVVAAVAVDVNFDSIFAAGELYAFFDQYLCSHQLFRITAREKH